LPGEVISRRQGEVLRRVSSEAELRALLSQLEGSDGQLISLIPQRATLEEVFLRDIRQAEGAAAGTGGPPPEL
jgi:hypothetical protein